VTNKNCNKQHANQLAPQLYKGNVDDCIILEVFNDTGNNYTLYQTNEMVTIKNNLIIPINTTIPMLTMVLDTGLDVHHCFFTDSTKESHYYNYENSILNSATDSYHNKIAAYIKHIASDYVDTTNGHGTHVVGIAVGNICGQRRGISPSSRIIFVDLAKEGSYLLVPSNMLNLFGTLGSKASSSSWGSFTRVYDQLTAQFDHYVYHIDRHYIHFVACGNSCPNGYVSSPALLKNGISVGGLDINGNIASYSCPQGNQKRMYPLIYLPGTNIVSAYAEQGDNIHFNFVPKTGTSMATPVALGLFYYIETRYKELGIDKSTNSLVRATYLANAEYPSRIFNSFKNDFFTNNKKWMFKDNEVVTSQTNYKICFHLNQGSDLKVVLSWIEPPSSELINDLDVMVRFQNNLIWGNHGLTSDLVNNNEIIYITGANTNRALTVLVSDTAVSNSPFSLVISSNTELQQIGCNNTCSLLDAPIECDFDEDGNSGYFICGDDGMLDRASCKFHECDVLDNAALVDGKCTRVNGTQKTVKNNGYYLEEDKLQACREQCYLHENICTCPYGVATLPPSSPPAPQLVRSNAVWMNVWQPIVIICFLIN
jgi:hypothetical protein